MTVLTVKSTAAAALHGLIDVQTPEEKMISSGLFRGIWQADHPFITMADETHIAAFNDKSGAGNNFTRFNTGTMATLEENQIGAFRAARFEGTSLDNGDYYSVAIPDYVANAAFANFFFGVLLDAGNGDYILGRFTDSNNQSFLRTLPGASELSFNVGTTRITRPVVVGEPFLAITGIGSGMMYMEVNGSRISAPIPSGSNTGAGALSLGSFSVAVQQAADMIASDWGTAHADLLGTDHEALGWIHDHINGLYGLNL